MASTHEQPQICPTCIGCSHPQAAHRLIPGTVGAPASPSYRYWAVHTVARSQRGFSAVCTVGCPGIGVISCALGCLSKLASLTHIGSKENPQLLRKASMRSNLDQLLDLFWQNFKASLVEPMLRCQTAARHNTPVEYASFTLRRMIVLLIQTMIQQRNYTHYYTPFAELFFNC